MKTSKGKSTFKYKSSIANAVVADTNIIIRALIDEDSEFSKIISNGEEIYIPLPIFFEVVFVLEKFYKQTREIIVDYISTIISYDNVFTEKNLLKDILGFYLQKPSLSIIDCFLIAYSKFNNLKVITFR